MNHLVYLTPKQTDRLIIRPLTRDDEKPWRAFLDDPVCTKFFPEEFLAPNNSAELWIESQLNRYEDHRFGLMALEEKTTGKFVGQSGLLHQELNGKDELEIGYHLFRKFHGLGFASEAAQLFKELGFHFTKTPSIISLIHPENQPSQAVAIRNGMSPDGLATYKDEKVLIFRVLREVKD